MINEGVQVIVTEFKGAVEKYEQANEADFNEDENFSKFTTLAVGAKKGAFKKVSMISQVWGHAPRQNVRKILDMKCCTVATWSMKEDLIEMTEVSDFPFASVLSGIEELDLGKWSPLGLEPWQLVGLRDMLAKDFASLRSIVTSSVDPAPSANVTEEGRPVRVELKKKGCEACTVDLDLAADFEAIGFVLGCDPNLKDLKLRILEHMLGPCPRLYQLSGVRHLLNLRQLDICFSSLGDEGAKRAAEGLLALSQLQELYFMNNQLGAQGALHVASAIGSMLDLRILNLSSNMLRKESAPALNSSLCHLVNLRKLYLYNNALEPEGLFLVADGVAKLPALVTLDLKHNCKKWEDALNWRTHQDILSRLGSAAAFALL